MKVSIKTSTYSASNYDSNPNQNQEKNQDESSSSSSVFSSDLEGMFKINMKKKAFSDKNVKPKAQVPSSDAEDDLNSSNPSDSTRPNRKRFSATQRLIKKRYYANTSSSSSSEDDDEPSAKRPNNNVDPIDKKLDNYLSSAKRTLNFEAEVIDNTSKNEKTSKCNTHICVYSML